MVLQAKQVFKVLRIYILILKMYQLETSEITLTAIMSHFACS